MLCFSCHMGFGYAQTDAATVTQIYIRYKSDAAHRANNMLTTSEAADLSGTAGVVLKSNTLTAGDRHILDLPHPMTRAQAWTIATKLAHRPDLAEVAPIDPEIGLIERRNPHAVK